MSSSPDPTEPSSRINSSYPIPTPPGPTDIIERLAVSQDVWDKIQSSAEPVSTIDTTGGTPIYLEPYLPPGFFIEYYCSGRLVVRQIDNTLST